MRFNRENLHVVLENATAARFVWTLDSRVDEDDAEPGDLAVDFDVGLPFTIQRVSPNYTKKQMIEIN